MSASISAGLAGIHRNPALAGAKVTFLRVLRSEWRKLWSLRSTWIMLLTGVVLTIGLAVASAWGIAALSKNGVDQGFGEGVVPAWMGANLAPSGLMFGALLVSVAFIVNMAGEYNTHTIVSTLSAVPARTPVYVAKALLALLISFVFGVVLHAVSFGLVALIFKAYSFDAPVPEGFTQDLLISGLYCAVLALIGLAVGALIRNTAGAIVVVVSLVLVISSVLGGLAMAMPGSDLLRWFSTHLPLEAVGALRPVDPAIEQAMTSMGASTGRLAAWDAWTTTGFWVVVPLIAGWLSFKLRPVK